jgi:hypothetical protein
MCRVPDFSLPARSLIVKTFSAVSFATMPYTSYFDSVGVGANEEKPVVANAQSKFVSSLQRFHVTCARFRKTVESSEHLHCDGPT